MGKIKGLIKRLPEILREWIWLAKYMRRYWLSIGFYILLGVFGVSMGLLVAYFQRNLINSITDPTGIILDRVINAATVVIALAVSQIFINAGSTWVSTRINIRVVNEIREDIFHKILASRWEYLCSYHSGDIINRLEGDVNTIAGGVIGFLPSLVTKLVQFFGAFIVILVVCEDPVMALVALASAPILFFSARPMMRIMRNHQKKMRDVNGRILSFNEEVFQNIQLVKAFSLGSDYCKNLRTLLREYRRIRLDYTNVSIIMSIVMGLIGLVAGYACYGWGVWRLYVSYANGTLDFTFGDMTMFLTLSGTLSSSFSALVGLVPSAVSTATAAGRVMEVTHLPAETDADAPVVETMRPIADAQGVCVRFCDVGFAYKNADSPVLKNVSFSVEPGQVAAFVGPSGGGKTTILRLMLGLLHPQEGSIDIITPDGSISAPVSESTRRLCSYVPQGNGIFSGTIESNLRSVAPDATEEEIIAALKVADAWNFVSELPDTYHTKLNERGLNLSEGQLQRLAIARAVLRNSPILIMDEATSALDLNTEARVLKNLMTDNPRRICLVTTHRSGILEYADLVFCVEGDGSVYRVTSATAER